MSHTRHSGPNDAVLFDDCAECEHRSLNTAAFFAHADPDTTRRTFARAAAWWGDGPDDSTRAEARLFYRLVPVLEAARRAGVLVDPPPVDLTRWTDRELLSLREVELRAVRGACDLLAAALRAEGAEAPALALAALRAYDDLVDPEDG